MKLKYVKSGDMAGDIMFFIHGWPDTRHVWEHQLDHYQKTYCCVCLELPNSTPTVELRWGIDFDEVVNEIKLALEQVRREHPGKQLTLVGHDWGGYLSSLVESRSDDLIDRLILLDVCGDYLPDALSQRLAIASYQIWLSIAFVLAKVAPGIGRAMSGHIARMAKAPNPVVYAHQNYFYFYLWRDFLKLRFADRLMRGYHPGCPTLYIYGTNNPVHFHSSHWLARMEADEHCQVIAFEGADHWFLLRKPQETNQAIDNFLSDGSTAN